MTIRSFEQRATVALVLALALIVAAALFCSRHWGVLHDSPIMHYLAWRIAVPGPSGGAEAARAE